MDTASLQFVTFGLFAVLVSNMSRSLVWRSIVLLVASLVFLGLIEQPLDLLLLAGFLAIGYGCLVLLRRGWLRETRWVVVAVIFVYVWLKKYTFLPAAILFHSLNLTLGLSYIFFRVLHLLIETDEGTETKNVGPLAYVLYMLNFTTFVSGPIQRYDEFARDQFAARPIPLGPRVIGLQFERILRGFFKVNVLAAIFDILRHDALTQMFYPLPPTARLYAALRLAALYPLFLYCNFSGYIDIVIALARLMRVRLPENFDRPFVASSFIDFWSRWHITLSTWLRTYVYNPMLVGLMRRFTSPTAAPVLAVICFFVTFLLVGVWHGRTSEFVMFGALQGGGISMNKIWQLGLARGLGRKQYKKLSSYGPYVAFGRGLTFCWFAFTLFWFWATWQEIARCYSAIGWPGWLGVWTALWLSATAILELWEHLRAVLLSIRTTEGPVLTGRYARVVYATALAVGAFLWHVLVHQPAPGIVYRAF